MSKLSSYDLFTFHQHGLNIFLLVGRHGVFLWCEELMVLGHGKLRTLLSFFPYSRVNTFRNGLQILQLIPCPVLLAGPEHLQKLSHLIANAGQSTRCGGGLQEGLRVSTSLGTCWNDSPTTLWQHRILCWNVWDFRPQSSDWPSLLTNDHKKKEGCYFFGFIFVFQPGFVVSVAFFGGAFVLLPLFTCLSVYLPNLS